MEVFPQLLIRIGGNSFEQLEQLNTAALHEKTLRIIALKKEKNKAKNSLCQLLLDYMKPLHDAKAQNTLQNLRRDLFNDRTVKPKLLEEANRYLNTALAAHVATYSTLLESVSNEIREGQLLYEAELARTRKHLQVLAQDENLRKGLVLSSQDLLNSIPNYLQKPVDDFRKKELRTEYGLLRYITRMAAKTSPFSTLNTLSLCGLALNKASFVQFETSDAAKKATTSHIRLNNFLFKYLLDLFRVHKDFYLYLPVRLNPTIKNTGEHLVYLVNNNNTEAFQRIGNSSLITIFLRLADQEKGGVRFMDMLRQAKEHINASDEDIEKFIKSLIDYGLLEFNVGVSGLDTDWDLKLVAQLQSLFDGVTPSIGELIATLQLLRKLADQFAVATSEERKEILVAAYESFKSIIKKLHEEAGIPFVDYQESKQQDEGYANPKAADAEAPAQADQSAAKQEKSFTYTFGLYFPFKKEQMFYEDTTLTAAAVFDEDRLSSYLGKLDELFRELYIFRGNAEDKFLIKHFFRNYYPPGTAVDLLTFYEDYYRELKKPLAERIAKEKAAAKQKASEATGKPSVQADATGNPAGADRPAAPPPGKVNEARKPALDFWLDVEEVNVHQDRIKQWSALFQEKIALLANKEVQIALGAEDFKRVNAALTTPSRQRVNSSYGVFVQFFEEEDLQGQRRLMGVVNGSFPGFGKMLSRFLHTFDDSLTQQVRKWNQKLADERSILMEASDASCFNANLHPLLMPYEIQTPNGNNIAAVDDQLPVTDFELRDDPATGEVVLWNKRFGKRAYVFDLGFQSLAGRSQLYQLTEKFTKAEYLHLQSVALNINEALNKSTGTAPEAMPGQVVEYPRVVYENQIIMQRKGWLIPRELLPELDTSAPNFDQYVKVNEWRTELGIMDEVFIAINPYRGRAMPGNGDQEARKKLGQDEYKPQYINFTSALLVNLFAKQISKVPVALRIEEMLPNSGQLTALKGKKYVTEYVAQWYQT